MGLLSKLFSKIPKPRLIQIATEFDPSKIKFLKQYLSEVVRILEDEDALPELAMNNVFHLVFGDTSAIHIIYWGAGDLHILMEPENQGWTATKVWLGRSVGFEEIVKKYGMKFLFKFANPYYVGKAPLQDGFAWTQDAYVYEFKRERSISYGQTTGD